MLGGPVTLLQLQQHEQTMPAVLEAASTHRCLFLLMDSKLRFFQRLSRISA